MAPIVPALLAPLTSRTSTEMPALPTACGAVVGASAAGAFASVVASAGAAAGLSAGSTTYVVYEDAAYEAEAQAIATALGATLINSDGSWIVAGNVMVVTGAA